MESEISESAAIVAKATSRSFAKIQTSRQNYKGEAQNMKTHGMKVEQLSTTRTMKYKTTQQKTKTIIFFLIRENTLINLDGYYSFIT